MRPVFLFTFLALIPFGSYSQLLDLDLGVSEKNLIRNAMPSRIEQNMEFISREANQITYEQNIEDSTHVLLVFSSRKGKIYAIKKESKGQTIDMRRALFVQYVEAVKAREKQSDMKINEDLIQDFSETYSNPGIRCKAYSNKKGTLHEVFIFYNEKNASVFIEIRSMNKIL